MCRVFLTTCVLLSLLSNLDSCFIVSSTLYFLSFCLMWSFFLSLAEPSRPQGGADGRGHGEESEPSDDEMLSLSNQRNNAAAAAPKSNPPSATPAAQEPPVEIDLLGLDGEDISRPCPSSQPASTAATSADLLGDLFGGPPQPTSGASSAQSTPRKVVPNPVSPCPSPVPPGAISYNSVWNM